MVLCEYSIQPTYEVEFLIVQDRLNNPLHLLNLWFAHDYQ